MSATALPAVVLTGPGTNRDRDVALALELAGAAPTIASVRDLAADPEPLRRARLAVVAGGFSHADALGAGRLLALELATELAGELAAHVAAGRPLLGICNGFQVLTQAGMLPGSLGHNASGAFDCRWVELEADPGCTSPWVAGLDATIHCPIAHGEGRYVHPDPEALAAAGQVALRYRGGNPNGSIADIAGVCDASGLVLGLMPHPENHVVARQHPQHRRCGAATTRHLGLALFRNGVRWAAS